MVDDPLRRAPIDRNAAALRANFLHLCAQLLRALELDPEPAAEAELILIAERRCAERALFDLRNQGRVRLTPDGWIIAEKGRTL